MHEMLLHPEKDRKEKHSCFVRQDARMKNKKNTNQGVSNPYKKGVYLYPNTRVFLKQKINNKKIKTIIII